VPGPGTNDFASFACDQNVHQSQKTKKTTTMKAQEMTVIIVGRLRACPPSLVLHIK